MNFHSLTERYLPLIKHHWLPLSLSLAGLILIVSGLISLKGLSSASSPVTFESAESASKSGSTNVKIMVDVEGAVVSPGVYSLTQDARLQDALVAAGGLSESADRVWVSKNLNMASKVTDGAKVYIPNMGEIITSTTSTTGITGSSNPGSISGLININTASESELDKLPGVGVVTAQKIIGNRPYSSLEELLNKKVVSSKVYGQIKDKISL